MLIRFNKTLTEVDTVEYIETEKQGKFVTGVQLAADTRSELETLLHTYTNISKVRFFDPEMYTSYAGPTYHSRYAVSFDGYEKINETGLSFKRADKEIYFLECGEDKAKDLLAKLAVDKYLDLRGV